MTDEDIKTISKFAKRRLGDSDYSRPVDLDAMSVEYRRQGNFFCCLLSVGVDTNPFLREYVTFVGISKRSPVDTHNEEVARAITLTRALQSALDSGRFPFKKPWNRSGGIA